MEKIFTKEETGIKVSIEKEATFFKVKKVLIEIHYAASELELKEDRNIHVRQHEIEVTDDLVQKLLSIHEGAEEVKEPPKDGK